MNILNPETMSDNTIEALLPGGRTGSFKLVVEKEIGRSNKKNFRYEIKVTGLSPKTGSVGGGTVLTITGENFSKVPNENQVFIGDESNQFCEVLTAASQELTCRMPPKHSSYAPDVKLSLAVFGKLQE